MRPHLLVGIALHSERNIVTLVSELCYLHLDYSRKQERAREDTLEVKEIQSVQESPVRPQPQRPFQMEELAKQSQEEVRLGQAEPNLEPSQA